MEPIIIDLYGNSFLQFSWKKKKISFKYKKLLHHGHIWSKESHDLFDYKNENSFIYDREFLNLKQKIK